MNAPDTIQEGTVLLATIRYLLARKAIPYQVSVASGQGIDAEQFKSEVRRIFWEVSFTPAFRGAGPDVVAVSEDEWWQVECKGVGTGKPQTQRHNFDRALASVVSYYDDAPEDLPNWAEGASPFLGLALPASTTYLSELRRRVRLSLRRQLNLWVLLHDTSTKAIRAVSPTDEYGDVAQLDAPADGQPASRLVRG